MITFRHPTSILIAGTTLAARASSSKILSSINSVPSRVIYFFGEHAPNLTDLKHLYPPFEYVQGMKNLLRILPTIEADEGNLVVLDD